MTNDIYTIQIIDYTNPKSHYLYGIWNDIKQRCFNPNCGCFKNYGAIGVTMFSEWIDDSRAFLMWVDSNLRNQTRRLYSR